MEKDKGSTVLIFFINGVNSLLGWNTILASLDYFGDSFEDYAVNSFLPVPLFVAYLIVGVLYHDISNRFKYVSLIITGNLITNIGLILILVVSIAFEQTLTGFILMMICSFILGIGGNTSQLTFFAMINYLSQDVVSKFTVGTAVSGLLTTAIRATITAIQGSGDKNDGSEIAFIGVAVVLNTLNIFLNIYFCRSSVYKHKIDHFLLHHDKEKIGVNPQIQALEPVHHHHHEHNQHHQETHEQHQVLVEQTKANEEGKEQHHNEEGHEQDKKDHNGDSSTQSQPENQVYVHEEERIQTQNYFRTMYETCMAISPYPFLILFNFVITFTLYPGPTFTKTFDNIDQVWKIIIFNLAYNIGDTAGKYAADIKNAFNPKSLFFAFFSRLYFFLPITYMAKASDIGDILTDNNIFPFVICFLFAFTNGFVINCSFIMAFRVAPLTLKKYAGVLCGLMLQIGIMLGTIVQIPYSIIFGIQS